MSDGRGHHLFGPGTAAADLSKTLPTRLQSTSGAARREHIERRDVAGDIHGLLTLERVELARGWRYEVNAEFDTRDHAGPVRRRDTLWLPDHDQAQRLMRAARPALAARTFESRGGLSGLARQLALTFDVQ